MIDAKKVGMSKLHFNKVLVLAPHTDDGELGAGGTIARLIEDGAEVTYVAFSIAEKSVPEGMRKNILSEEVRLATSHLGIHQENLIIYNYEVRKLNYVRQDILERLIDLRRFNCFDLVLIPSLNDVHQDHLTIAQEGLRAFKNTTILGYELLWNNLTFDNQCFIELEERHILKKIEALAYYESQKNKAYVTAKFLKSLAHTRGVQIGKDYAESFQVIRLLL